VRGRLGQAEVGDEHPFGAVRRRPEQHVARVDVPVDHTDLVQHGEPAGGVRAVPQRGADRQRPAGQPVGQRAAVGVRHHEVWPAVRQLADVVHPHHPVRVGPAQDPGLLLEPRPHVQPVGPVVSQHLDRDRSVEHVVAG
jgi:hypothetical protein